jgi:hypothetical protein
MQAMRQLNIHPRGFFFFLLGGREEDGLKKSSGISIMLPACPHIFPRFPMCSSRILPITPHFIPYPLPKLVFPFSVIYSRANGEKLLHRNCNLGSLLNSCFLCEGAIKIAHSKKNKNQNLGGSPSNENLGFIWVWVFCLIDFPNFEICQVLVPYKPLPSASFCKK